MRYLFIIFLSLILSKVLLAEDITVDMLNKLEKRRMVFNQEIVRINPGDTVFWKSIDKGHNVEFISKNGIPEGVEKFKSKIGKDTEFTFTIPGIYAYWCVPHKTMGMIGFVIVNDDTFLHRNYILLLFKYCIYKNRKNTFTFTPLFAFLNLFARSRKVFTLSKSSRKNGLPSSIYLFDLIPTSFFVLWYLLLI